MTHEFRDITESEAEYLSRHYRIPVAQAKEWFGRMTTVCDVPWIENTFADEAVRNCNTNPRSANTVADAQVEPEIAKTKEMQ